MTTQINPCKTCGEMPETIEGEIHGNPICNIRCGPCGAFAWHSTLEKASEAWNEGQRKPELKPCPFCGEIPFVTCGGYVPHDFGGMTFLDTAVSVRCNNEQCLVKPGATGREHELVTDAWNTRKEPTP